MTTDAIPEGEIRMQQIVPAQFNTNGTLTYSMFGLGVDGVVYRYDPKCEGWIPWPMKIVTCRTDHKARR